MVRPIKPRRVQFDPKAVYFKPRAIPLSMLDEVELSLDEIEALRLCDLEGLNQVEAAKRMKIFKTTICRILISVKKVAEALIEGIKKVKKDLVENFLFSPCFGL